MGQVDNEATQDDLEGSVAPLGLSRSYRISNDGIWTPVIRKALAITLGGLALAAIGAISMFYHPKHTPNLEHLTASVNGATPLEWLAMNGGTADVQSKRPENQASDGMPNHPNAAPSQTNVAPTSSILGANPPPSAPSVEPPSSGGASKATGILPDGRVVLNQATASELQTLPGIGQKRAESIIALRERLRGFKKLSDLLRVKGIGVKSLRKLEPKVTLNPP